MYTFTLRGPKTSKTAIVTCRLFRSKIASFPTRSSATSPPHSLVIRLPVGDALDNNNFRNQAFPTTVSLLSHYQQDRFNHLKLLSPDSTSTRVRTLHQPWSIAPESPVFSSPLHREGGCHSSNMASHCIDLTSDDELDRPALSRRRSGHSSLRTQGTFFPCNILFSCFCPTKPSS